MGRPKEFDPDAALARAVEVFWCRGFEATSVQDLVDHLGVARGSLYATFGNKEAMYARALERYRREQGDLLVALLSADRPVRESIRLLLDGVVEDALRDPDHRGCFVVNAACERLPGDADTALQVGEQFQRVEDVLAQTLTRARQRGELAHEKDPGRLAGFLLTALQGLRVVGKAQPQPQRLHDAVQVILSTLE
jgi:TetR/AcrR family transcriptional repressor of nem operon